MTHFQRCQQAAQGSACLKKASLWLYRYPLAPVLALAGLALVEVARHA